MKPLAFILITYNRPDDTLALLKNIATLNEIENLVEEIILINNASTADYTEVENYIKAASLPIQYHYSDENLGVARGRNLAIQKSKAPVLIMLDDDAELQNKNALVNLVKEYETDIDGKQKAIVSFKVLYYDTLEMQKTAFPQKNFERYKDKHFFETYYYAGGAHAIIRQAIEKVGNYPTDFFYGMEEYDLSYRLLNAGYAIVYSDSVVMLHKESPLGRSPKKEKLKMMWINKAKVAWRYLPQKYFYSTAFMWSLHYLKKSGFDLNGFLKGWKDVFQITKTETKSTISKEVLWHLKSLDARLWY